MMKKCLRDLRRLEPAADLLKAGEREREPLEREKDTTKETLDEGSRKRRRCQCCSKLLLWLGHSGNGGRAEVCNAAVDEVMQRLAYRGCQCKLSCLVASGSGRLLRPRLLHFNRRLSSATGNCVSAPAAQAIVMQDHHLPQLLSVAPMMDWTDLHFRQLCRLVSKHTWLWTEMVVDQTLIHNTNTDRFLWFPPEQHPIVCQLGGSNPDTLAAAAKKVASYGYDEINLNCGCPSERVAGAGCFGAAMMLQPELVARCCQAMQDAVPHIPVTVKCRLGVDETDSYEAMCRFITVVSEQSSVRHFILHCRKCMLSGLNPAQNRTIPPLRREWAWALKRDFPHLQFSLNGAVQSCHEAAAVLQHRHSPPASPLMQDQPVMCPPAHLDAYSPAESLALQQHEHAAAALDEQTNSATDATLNLQHKHSGAVGLDQQHSGRNATVSAGDCDHAVHHQQNGSKAASASEGQFTPASDHQQENNSAAANDQQHGGLDNGVSSANTIHSQQERDSAAASDQQHGGLDNGVSSASTGHSQQGAAAQDLEGVMIGRQAFYQTWNCLADADRAVFGAADNTALSRRQVLEEYAKYGDAIIGRWHTKPDGSKSPNVRTVFKPLLNMFHSERGSKRWKQAVDAGFKKATSVSGLLKDTLHHIPDEVLDAPPKQCNIPNWQPSSDMPPPAKRQRTDSGSRDEAMAMAVQAKTAEGGATHDSGFRHQTDEGANGPVVRGSSQPDAVPGQNLRDGSHAHNEANGLAAESSAQAQDKVLLEKGDCAAAAPVAA